MKSILSILFIMNAKAINGASVNPTDVRKYLELRFSLLTQAHINISPVIAYKNALIIVEM